MLTAHLRARRGPFDLDLLLEVASGEVVVLVGPNGAGKSTALGCLAGLVPESTSVVRLDGEVLDDPALGRRASPDRRPVGMAFQDRLLFPHLTAVENVAFGLRARGIGRHLARTRARDWLARMGLSAYEDARPGQLSGGQASRVALARALAVEPRVLLLDEPLAALDAATRLDVRAELRAHLDEFAGAAVLVTHDPVDALALADRVTVMEAGRAVQEGEPVEIATRPRTDYVARLVGRNLLRGRATGGELVLAGSVRLPMASALEGEALVAIAPSGVLVSAGAGAGVGGRDAAGSWVTSIARYEQHGSYVRLTLGAPVPLIVDVLPADFARLPRPAGSPVSVAVAPAAVEVYAP